MAATAPLRTREMGLLSSKTAVFFISGNHIPRATEPFWTVNKLSGTRKGTTLACSQEQRFPVPSSEFGDA